MTIKYTYKQHNRTLVHNVHSAVSKMLEYIPSYAIKISFLYIQPITNFSYKCTNVYNLSEKNICLYPQT